MFKDAHPSRILPFFVISNALFWLARGNSSEIRYFPRKRDSPPLRLKREHIRPAMGHNNNTQGKQRLWSYQRGFFHLSAKRSRSPIGGWE